MSAIGPPPLPSLAPIDYLPPAIRGCRSAGPAKKICFGGIQLFHDSCTAAEVVKGPPITATPIPTPVVISALEIPAEILPTRARSRYPWNVLITPKVVPKRPTKGAVEPISPTQSCRGAFSLVLRRELSHLLDAHYRRRCGHYESSTLSVRAQQRA